MGDKNLGIDPVIGLCAIEDGYETEEVEEAEIIVVYDSSIGASKQNLVNKMFPYINTFDHEGPAFFSAMRDLPVGVFENLKITSPMDVDKRLTNTQRTIRVAALIKYRVVLVTCRQSEKDLAGNEWTLVKLTGIRPRPSPEVFCG